MRWQTTAILAVLLAALGGFYYVYEVRLGPEREKALSRKGRVFSVDTGEVSEVTLTHGGEVVRVTREGDGWQMTAPLAWRGDKGTIESTLTSIADAKMDREIAAQPGNLDEFGLAKPAAEATLTTKNGKHVTLLLGARNPTGAWVYAKEVDKPAVFVVDESVLRAATKPVADYRDKTIVAFDRESVTGFDVVTRDETLAVEAAGEHGWRLTRPRALPADADAVRDLFEKLTTARIKEFVADAPPSLAPYGLERPVRLLLRTGKDKDRATRVLVFGDADAKKKGVYALREGESSVLLLPEEVLKAVPKTTAAIRDKTVVAFDRDKVTRLALESPRGEVTLVREQDRWRITRPEALPADQVQAGAVMTKLKNLKALAFLAEDASGIARYLSRPAVKVTITQPGEPARQTVLLAPAPDKRGGQATAYAAIAGRGPVVLVDATALTEVGRSLAQLRDRTLIAGLEPREVKRVQIRSSGKSLLLERSGDLDWRIVEGGKGAANATKVDNLLYSLRGLKWKEIQSASGADAPKYGLDAPTSEITLFRGDGTIIATVLLGKREGRTLYLSTKATPTIYEVDGRLLTLPKIPDDLQG